jgi:hypothetical protein
MAKTAKPKSKAQIAADQARKAYSDAKERDAKGSNATTKAAVDHAKTTMTVAVKVENRGRFLDVGGGRFGKILSTLDTLKQVANRRTYEYSQPDIDKAFASIDAKVAEVKATFVTAMQTAPTAEKKAAPKVFKFE